MIKTVIPLHKRHQFYSMLVISVILTLPFLLPHYSLQLLGFPPTSHSSVRFNPPRPKKQESFDEKHLRLHLGMHQIKGI